MIHVVIKCMYSLQLHLASKLPFSMIFSVLMDKRLYDIYAKHLYILFPNRRTIHLTVKTNPLGLSTYIHIFLAVSISMTTVIKLSTHMEIRLL